MVFSDAPLRANAAAARSFSSRNERPAAGAGVCRGSFGAALRFASQRRSSSRRPTPRISRSAQPASFRELQFSTPRLFADAPLAPSPLTADSCAAAITFRISGVAWNTDFPQRHFKYARVYQRQACWTSAICAPAFRGEPEPASKPAAGCRVAIWRLQCFGRTFRKPSRPIASSGIAPAKPKPQPPTGVRRVGGGSSITSSTEALAIWPAASVTVTV